MHFNKNGFAYMLDRGTGQLLNANVFAPSGVTWATDVNLTTGLPTLVPAMQTHQGASTSGDCPSALGGKDWEPASYSPTTHLFYIPGINFCQNLYPMQAVYIAGTPFIGNSVTLYPGGTNMGQLIAWNPVKSAAAWTVDEPLALYGGTLATAGNLVFYGTLDKHFKAVNATTGQLVFDTVLECGIVSNPMTYTGPDGKQRVTVMTGVGYLAGGLAGGNCPAGTIWGNAAKVTPNAAVDPAPASTGMRQITGVAPQITPPAAVTGGMVHVFKLP